MIKKLLFLTFVFVAYCSTNATAQDLAFPKYRLGITPSSFLNWHPAVQLSFDMGFKEVYNFSIEGGYVFNSAWEGKGYRLRPGIEAILARGQFVALSAGFHVNYRHSWEYNINRSRATNGEFVFITYNNKVQRVIIGANLSENLIIKLSKRSYLELGSGIGIGSYIVNRKTPFVPATDFNDFNNFGIQATVSQFPVFYIHCNFSYAISL